MMTLQRAIPVSNQLQRMGFDLCHNVPCFMGIVPQETTMQETTQQLLPYLKPDVLVSNAHAENTFEINQLTGRFGSINDENSDTEYVDFDGFDTDFPTLGDFVLLYGQPCYIRVWEFTPGISRTKLFYPDLVIAVVGSSTGPLSPHQAVESLSLVRASNMCFDPENRVIYSDWRGFASTASYK